MKGTYAIRKTMAMMLAVLFTFAAVFTVASVPAYAASKPAKVTGIKATARSNYTIKVTWKKAKYAKKYQVYRAKTKNGKYTRITTVTGTSFINSNLKKGTKYYYKVRAINGSKKGAFSIKKYAYTKNDPNYDVVVDKTERSVTISAELNGDFFDDSTRHLMVDRYGFNKGKSILTSYCVPDDLYNGLVKAGGVSWSKTAGKALKNGQKNTVSNAENKNFSRLDVTLSWEDEEKGLQTYNLSECLTTVNEENVPPVAPEIDMIFAANPKAAAKTPSGCMVCMDSCYIGIVANSAYGLCVIDDENPPLFARKDVLPPDGTVVKVTFTIK